METPFLRAKAKDAADELDNTVAYLEEEQRSSVEDYVFETFRAAEQVLVAAQNEGTDLLVAYKMFVGKVRDYYHSETANT